jgi:hypothetical protein
MMAGPLNIYRKKQRIVAGVGGFPLSRPLGTPPLLNFVRLVEEGAAPYQVGLHFMA